VIPLLKVKCYATVRGTEPVREWLRELSDDDRKAIGEDTKTVQFGWPLGMPLVRKMATDLWEVRSNITDGIARVFFTVAGAEMVLLHGFVKKARTTPPGELATAKKRMKEVRHGPT
jgi:phage-related protein